VEYVSVPADDEERAEQPPAGAQSEAVVQRAAVVQGDEVRRDSLQREVDSERRTAGRSGIRCQVTQYGSGHGPALGSRDPALSTSCSRSPTAKTPVARVRYESS
jgi:hypothetical protein